MIEEFDKEFAVQLNPEEMPVPETETYYLLVGKFENVLERTINHKWSTICLSTDMEKIKIEVNIMKSVAREMKLFKLEMPL